jgi:hypothetical protein
MAAEGKADTGGGGELDPGRSANEYGADESRDVKGVALLALILTIVARARMSS